ncbi:MULTISPECIES: hypothetical protein [unclassified Pantoea]|uniref:hypothetical protein n=1 Tax=unclassified Pantoea TaxID=2630326 RepID=UPI0012329DF7|nr:MULTISPECIES: hypothetical protein [unclassified Pantoea]KAA6096664.1 hypothetical protein F3I21_19305 [Pantoea sp. B_9]KAA6114302.1 hypothetical protein F3I18_09980 [Pantoea sp. B_10]
MRHEYQVLKNNLLNAYHSKVMVLKAATAVAPQVRENSLADYAFRLSIGLEGLVTVANASGDAESADELESVVAQCNRGEYPSPSVN